MIDQALQKLIDAISKVAPEVWATLMRQTQIQAIQNIVWIVILIVAFFIALKAVKIGYKIRADEYAREKENHYDHPDLDKYAYHLIFGYLAMITFVVVSAMLINNTIGLLINPQFYAIEFLLHQVGK